LPLLLFLPLLVSFSLAYSPIFSVKPRNPQSKLKTPPNETKPIP
jgi:hypothetical protein